MIICICKNINQGTLQAAISDGFDTPQKLKDQLGICSQCYKCANAIKEEIEKTED